MHVSRQSLLVRVDFVLSNKLGGDRVVCKRWRRVLADALPRLLGCARCCARAVVCLHLGEGEAKYSGWLRIPIKRHPSRTRLRRFKVKLRRRLEAGLLPVDGRVVKVGVRRCRVFEPETLPLFDAVVDTAPLAADGSLASASA